MSAHKFSVGQRLEFLSHPSASHVPRGAYTVVRLLPNDAPDREYRVKSLLDGHERVMQESQFVASGKPGQSTDPGSWG